MTSLEAALEMIDQGVIEVRQDGSVWKLKNLNHIPFTGPRRTECRAKAGYLIVKVCFDGLQYVVLAHRLVWTVLRDEVPEGMDLNHIDGNKTNNAPENLEVVSRGDNHRHAYRTGLRGRSDVPGAIAASAKELRGQGKSFSQIAAALGVSSTTAFRATRLP